MTRECAECYREAKPWSPLCDSGECFEKHVTGDEEDGTNMCDACGELVEYWTVLDDDVVICNICSRGGGADAYYRAMGWIAND